MRLRIDRTPRSKRDAFEIWDFVSPSSRIGAERLLRRIDKIILMLGERPEAGRKRRELAYGVRSFPAERYVIFYRASATQVTILRILHSARDVTPDMLVED